jgi:hypothetical protein
MERTITTIVKELHEQLTSSKRSDGTTFWHFKEDTSETMKDKFRDMIHGTDFMPCDYRYGFAVGLLDTLLEYDYDTIDELEDLELEICSAQEYTYSYDLLEWLSSNLKRLDYCNEAIEFCGNNIEAMIAGGQSLEIQEIFMGIISYIESELQ